MFELGVLRILGSKNRDQEMRQTRFGLTGLHQTRVNNGFVNFRLLTAPPFRAPKVGKVGDGKL